MSEPFPLIEIEGPPEERGRSYGRQAGDRIARGFEIYGDSFKHSGADLESLSQHYLRQLEEFDASLAAELRGIAEGAELPVSVVMAMNARTELTAWDAAVDPDGCTSGLALPERTLGGKMLVAQNWDWRPACAETSVVLRIRGWNEPDILTLCEAGQLARHGMNSAGLAIAANGLQTDKENKMGGLPSPFARRRMLMETTLAEATGVLLNTPRSASHNLLLGQIDAGGRAEALNFETTPEETFYSLPEAGLFTHSNHFKHPAAILKLTDVGLLRHPESLYRDRRLRAHLEAAGASITVETFQHALADDFGAPHSICRQPAGRVDGSFSASIASVIMDPAAGEMWIAPSPYKGVAYTRYGLAA